MKNKLLALLAALALLWTPFGVSAGGYPLPEEIYVSAPSALLMYIGTKPEEDAVIFEREADVRRSPAATVRVMVGLYAVRQLRARHVDIDTATGTYDRSCWSQITGTGLGVVNMQIGDTWTLRDLLTASLAETAADACVTLCTAVSGDVSAFVDGMNGLAKELGCTSTAFANVTGLDALGQYTTARDLALITRAAMEYPELVTAMSVTGYEVHPVVGRSQTRPTTNSMLRKITDSYYPKLQFGRTGYADEAGRCMVSVAKDGGYRYMAVVLGSKKEDGSDWAIAHFEDSRSLFEWAFAKFAYKNLLTEGQPVSQLKVDLAWSADTAVLAAGAPFGTVVPKDLDVTSVTLTPRLEGPETVDAPITKGDAYGTVEVYIDRDHKLGEVPMVAGESVERSQVLAVWRVIRTFFTSKWLYAVIGGLALLIAAYVILSVVHNRRRRKGRRR